MSQPSAVTILHIGELLTQGHAAIADARTALLAHDYDKAVATLRRLEEIAVFARYVVLSTRTKTTEGP